MKERPILFSAPMVRALLDGSKSQTRRAMKTQLVYGDVCGLFPSWYLPTGPESGILYPNGKDQILTMCPYGQPGDRLWVRETFFAYGRWVTRFSEKKRRDEWHFIDMTLECDRAYQYAADNPDVPLAVGRGGMPGWWKRPAIFMPRAACRAVPEIVSVRVERLNVISSTDAEQEGVKCNMSARGFVEHFRDLWERINGAGSWTANPWVWVVEFKRVTP